MSDSACFQQSPRERIAHALLHARAKHPDFASSSWQAVAVLGEEVGEVSRAVLEGDRENLREELAQVAAVCWRWLERLDREEEK